MKADLRDFVLEHGGELAAGGREARIPGPGHSKRDRSLSLRLTDEGRVLWNDFSGAHSVREVSDYLGLAKLDERLTPAEREAAQRLRLEERERLDAEKLAFCQAVWADAIPAAGTAVERYLDSRHVGGQLIGDICFHPAAPRAVPWNRMDGDPEPPPPHPAMLCLARDVRGRPRGLHATFLTDDGRKAFGHRSRIMMGPMSGAALQMGRNSSEGVLAVGEGMETARAFNRRHGHPCWATFSTSGLRNFVVPYGVRRLIIAADNDENGAGLSAAQALAARAAERCSVDIAMPDQIGDWADGLEAA